MPNFESPIVAAASEQTSSDVVYRNPWVYVEVSNHRIKDINALGEVVAHADELRETLRVVGGRGTRVIASVNHPELGEMFVINRESRFAIGGVLQETPAGGRKRDKEGNYMESIEETAARELEEETGIKASQVKARGQIALNPDMMDFADDITFAEGEYRDDMNAGDNDVFEAVLGSRLYSLPEVCHMIGTGEITDSASIAGIMLKLLDENKVNFNAPLREISAQNVTDIVLDRDPAEGESWPDAETGPWNITKRDHMYDGQTMDVYAHEFAKGEQKGIYGTVEMKQRPVRVLSTMVNPETGRESLAIQISYSHPLEKYIMGLPGGRCLVDQDGQITQAPADAAVHQLKQIGVATAAVDQIARADLWPTIVRDSAQIFVARENSIPGELELDAQMIDLQTVCEYIKTGVIIDAASIVGIYHYLWQRGYLAVESNEIVVEG